MCGVICKPIGITGFFQLTSIVHVSHKYRHEGRYFQSPDAERNDYQVYELTYELNVTILCISFCAYFFFIY